jgi:CheY-like chemotaxis protein
MTSTDVSSAPKAIMVVDDEDDIVYIFRKTLELAGYGVFAFTDPILALEHLRMNSDRYGLIVSDVRMPQLSGIEFASKAQEIAPNIPFILMSAFNMSDLQLPDGVKIERLLQKPVTPLQLREIVSAYTTLAADVKNP